MALITLVDYKAFYGITSTTDDVLNQLMIDIAESMITSFLGRDINLNSYIEIHDGGVSTLILDASPVVSITDFTILSIAEPITVYSLYKNTGILTAKTNKAAYYTRQPTFNGGIQDLQISYTAGYTVIPSDIQYCAFILTKKLTTDKTAAASSGLKRQRLHGEDREFFQGSSPNTKSQIAFMGNEVVALLQNYL